MSLLLDVANLPERPLHIDRTDDPPAFGPLDEVRAVSPVSLAFEVRKDGEKVRVAGRLQGVMGAALPAARLGMASFRVRHRSCSGRAP